MPKSPKLLVPALLLVAGVTLLMPCAADASGAFGTRYVHERFSYAHREHVRKIFRSGRQARGYFAGKERAFYRRVARALPAVNRVLARAKKKRIPLTRYRVDSPVIRLPRIKDVAAISAAAYPLNLSIQRESPISTDTFELSFRKPPTARRLAWLVKGLAAALAPGEQDPVAEVKALEVAAPAVCALAGDYGLFVGANLRTDAAGKAAMERSFAAELKRLMPAMGEKLAAAGALKELGVSGGLLPLGPEVAKRKLPAKCLVFNRHGPLVDGAGPELVRTSALKGSMMVTVLVAPKEYDWGKLNPTFSRWISGLLGDQEHRDRARREQARLDLTHREGRRRHEAISILGQFRTARTVALLNRVRLDRKEDQSIRDACDRALETMADGLKQGNPLKQRIKRLRRR